MNKLVGRKRVPLSDKLKEGDRFLALEFIYLKSPDRRHLDNKFKENTTKILAFLKGKGLIESVGKQGFRYWMITIRGKQYINTERLDVLKSEGVYLVF